MSDQHGVQDRASILDRGFQGMTRWGIRVIVIAATIVVVGWVIGQFWMILFPVTLALIVCTLLAPPVTWLRHRGLPSALAAALVLLTFLTALIGGIVALAPSVAGQAGEIASGASAGLDRIQEWVRDGPLAVTDTQFERAIEAVQDRLEASAGAISSGVFTTISAATNVIINLVLTLVLTFYFLKDGHKFVPWTRTLGGPRVGEHVSNVLGRSWNTLGGFIRTQGLVSLIDAVLIGLALVILDVPLAIPLAVITFFGGFIPIIGALVTGALAVLITLVTNSPSDALIVFIVVIAVQQLEGNVLSPLLQGKSMNLHAAIILLAVTAGGTLFGISGAFLAVPVTAVAAAVLRYVNECINDQVDAAAPDEDAQDSEPDNPPHALGRNA